MVLAYSEDVYNWLTLIHVLAAIVWVGGGVFAQIYAARLMRANDAARLMGFARDIERFGAFGLLGATSETSSRHESCSPCNTRQFQLANPK